MSVTMSQLLVDRKARARAYFMTPAEAHRFRAERTALRTVRGWLLPGESEDCAEVATRLQALASRADSVAYSESTLRSYVSRVARVFGDELKLSGVANRKPRRTAAPKAPPELPFEAQMREALTALARWPLLRAGLLPALIEIDSKMKVQP